MNTLFPQLPGFRVDYLLQLYFKDNFYYYFIYYIIIKQAKSCDLLLRQILTCV